MICPSCNSPADGQSHFCIRCGFSLAKHGPFLSRVRQSATWILRRSMSGLSTGFVGWIVIPVAARAAGESLPPWGHMLLSGAIGGYFLGIVEGMVENSTIKTIRGGALGMVGGLIGGALGSVLLHYSDTGTPAVLLTWGVAGAIIGIVSVWMEKKPHRIFLGGLAGFIGGSLGGWLGYQMYYSLIDMAKPETWALKRAIEGTTGAVVGALLWAIVGGTEKLWIFRRRLATNVSYKDCDRCQHINLLKAWYCAGCGALLQVAAPAEKMQWTRREALARVISACRFLAQLCAMTGAAICCLMLVFLSVVNVFLALFGFLATCLITYLLYTLFYAVSDVVSSLLETSSEPRAKPAANS